MIGGNTTMQLQKRTVTKNEIGEQVNSWETIHSIKGYLDMSGGDARYTTYNAKIQESTHLFIFDYVAIDKSITAENSRVVDEDGLVYDVMMIDDPMKLHKHIEIYLKYTGGQ